MLSIQSMNTTTEAMKSLLAVALQVLVLVLVLVQWENVCVSGSEFMKDWRISTSCREEERSALLQINASLPFLSYYGNWDDKQCCQWESVTCDPITGHVTELDLGISHNGYQQVISLNATMFLPLRYLRFLSLSGYGIYNCTDGSGFESWSRLTKLEFLDLSYNYLPKSIISSIARVSSLRALYLDHNNMGSNAPVKGFESWSRLTKLELLDLSYNDLPKSIISSLAGVSSLRALHLDHNYMGGNVPVKELSALNLEEVSLSGCMLNGSFPYLGHWSSLKALSLASNHLTGTLTSKGLCRLKNLEELDLSFNNIAGNLPLCMGNLSSLKLVDLHYNKFQVKFPSSIFEKLVSLWYLSLSYNQFEGTLSIRSFLNHSNLEVLRLSTWSLSFRVEVVDMPFQLQKLELANCILDAEPTFLYSQYKLEVLDLSNTSSKGPVMLLLENNTNLIELYLHKNNFTGPVQLPFLEALSILDLSSNKLTSLVGNISEEFAQMKILDLSNNHLSGAIPNSISNLWQLESLDLSHNSLTGEIPRGLTKLNSLGYFSVAYNDLSGPTLGVESLFRTFDNSSYEGNPNLCGPPLSKSCVPTHSTTLPSPNSSYDSTDHLILFGSFSLFFVVSFCCFMAILYFKRNWRCALFTLVDRYSGMIYVKVVLSTRKIGAARTRRG